MTGTKMQEEQLQDEQGEVATSPKTEQIENSEISEVSQEPEIMRLASTITGGKLYRTTSGCYQMFRSEAWGRYLMPIDDPDYSITLSDEEKNGIRLNKDFPKIPADLWSRWVALCFYMCPQTSSKMSSSFHSSQLEVQVCLLRDAETKTKWKIVIPKQVVSGVSVKAELKDNIDIVTGERYTQFPPEGWLYAGTSHSHNTMGAFFSGTDNKSELACPGFHAVIGNIDHENKEYTFASSIVLRKMRKEIELEEVVDASALEREFHEDVLDYIDTIVSANRKLYEAKLQPTSNNRTPLLPWAELSGFDDSEEGDFFSTTRYTRQAPGRDVEKDEIDINDIDDLDDLDLYDLDEAKHFPYHEEISSIIDTVLSQGYTITDLLLSMRKAKEEYDSFLSSERFSADTLHKILDDTNHDSDMEW